ncbi:MAG: alkaline phosphatase family protein [Armatimonadota bacterium]
MARPDRTVGASNSPEDPGKRETLRKLAALGALAAVGGASLPACGRRALWSRGRERKVIVLGLDGLDPRGIAHLMRQDRLPNMKRLMEMGGYRWLRSSIPPQSPVAWATFITGQDPGGHGIYDFVQRDPKTYLPYLSIARTEPPTKTLSVGRWKLPLSGGKVELLRRGRAFWDVLGEAGVPGVVYRAPSNFPPQDNGVRQLAGLGAPDLRGTYGEFSFYTDEPQPPGVEVTGGAVYPVVVNDGRARARLVGPDNTLREGAPATAVDFDILVDRAHDVAKVVLGDSQVVLRPGEWSDWVTVRFELIPHLRWVSGICLLYLKQVSPYLKLYISPVNVDPRAPALPITAPADFAGELARSFGPFYTQGFPHDVKALRQNVLDDEEYLHQSDICFREERRMWESALHSFRRGLLFYYFATSDRTQHMFWRTIDPRHPAYDPKVAAKLGGVLPDCYVACDELVGQAMEALDADTTLIVMSDHGFAPYYRSFHLNRWLADRGYLAGVEPWEGERDIFGNADWRSTLAYGIGFNSLYLNLEGREPYGVVGSEDRGMLLRQLADELRDVRDPENGEKVIDAVYLAEEAYSGDQAAHAPDLVIGYARGYRCSDDSVLGKVARTMTEVNLDKWSGDHCAERKVVPGILYCSRRLAAERPDLRDVTATVLAEFGVKKPDGMAGEPVVGGG